MDWQPTRTTPGRRSVTTGSVNRTASGSTTDQAPCAPLTLIESANTRAKQSNIANARVMENALTGTAPSYRAQVR